MDKKLEIKKSKEKELNLLKKEKEELYENLKKHF